MAVSDLAEVDAAIMAILSGDATLMSLMPDGVFYDVAAPGSQRFVVFGLLDYGQEPILEGLTGYETVLYLIKAVALDTAGAAVAQAAQRIHELMQNAAIGATGYVDMHCHRIEVVDYADPDEIADLRWQHRGGHYELWLMPEG